MAALFVCKDFVVSLRFHHLRASSKISRASSSFPSSFMMDPFTKRNTGLLPTLKLKLSACSRLLEAALYLPSPR